ncbi:hypothetical protein [Guggenheimella bovis]
MIKKYWEIMLSVLILIICIVLPKDVSGSLVEIMSSKLLKALPFLLLGSVYYAITRLLGVEANPVSRVLNPISLYVMHFVFKDVKMLLARIAIAVVSILLASFILKEKKVREEREAFTYDNFMSRTMDAFLTFSKCAIFASFFISLFHTYFPFSTLRLIGKNPFLSILFMVLVVLLLRVPSVASSFYLEGFLFSFETSTFIAGLIAADLSVVDSSNKKKMATVLLVSILLNLVFSLGGFL